MGHERAVECDLALAGVDGQGVGVGQAVGASLSADVLDASERRVSDGRGPVRVDVGRRTARPEREKQRHDGQRSERDGPELDEC